MCERGAARISAAAATVRPIARRGRGWEISRAYGRKHPNTLRLHGSRMLCRRPERRVVVLEAAVFCRSSSYRPRSERCLFQHSAASYTSVATAVLSVCKTSPSRRHRPNTGDGSDPPRWPRSRSRPCTGVTASATDASAPEASPGSWRDRLTFSAVGRPARREALVASRTGAWRRTAVRSAGRPCANTRPRTRTPPARVPMVSPGLRSRT